MTLTFCDWYPSMLQKQCVVPELDLPLRGCGTEMVPIKKSGFSHSCMTFLKVLYAIACCMLSSSYLLSLFALLFGLRLARKRC